MLSNLDQKYLSHKPPPPNSEQGKYYLVVLVPDSDYTRYVEQSSYYHN